MKYEIEIPRTLLHRSSVVFLIAFGLAGLVLLGYRNSPVGLSGRPILLSPHLAELTRYQHNALRWADELQTVQAGLGSLLENPPADLLAQDTRANALVDRLAALQAEMEDTTPPPTLQVLQDAIQNALEQTSLAAAGILTWISEPTDDNRTTALDALHAATAALARLDQDPWMKQP
jgi:hypothetical protein